MGWNLMSNHGVTWHPQKTEHWPPHSQRAMLTWYGGVLSAVPVSGKRRQKTQKIKVNLVYTVSLKPDWALWGPVTRKNNKSCASSVLSSTGGQRAMSTLEVSQDKIIGTRSWNERIMEIWNWYLFHIWNKMENTGTDTCRRYNEWLISHVETRGDMGDMVQGSP